MSIHTCVCLFFCYAQMDSEGFIPIGLIASFYRVQALTQDVNLILEVCKHNVQELRVAFDEKFVKLHNFLIYYHMMYVQVKVLTLKPQLYSP